MYMGEAQESWRPVENRLENTWKPVHAGGHIVYNREAAGGRPGGHASGRNTFFSRPSNDARNKVLMKHQTASGRKPNPWKTHVKITVEHLWSACASVGK